ncbi:MAG: hypothetical protein U9R14_02605 [Patescibacteria group bacterium]|nr:hypothetical protein [Patescibacteria group bacterium]
MLEQLFGSRARVKILKLFLLNPREKFYIRELSRKLKLQLNSVRRELENLERFGVLIAKAGAEEKEEGELICVQASAGKPACVNTTAGKHKKKYYQANLNFILFEEIKALIIKSQILYEKNFINKLQKIGKVKLLILTGIFVNNFNSRIDLLIIGRINKIKLLKLIKELESELSKEVNFTLMDTREFKYRKDVTDVFLYKILEGKKIIVINEVGIV